MAKLAATWRRPGKDEEAEPAKIQVLELRIETLGRKHPHTITSMACLAWTWHSLGKHKDAEETETEVLELRTEILGPLQPEALRAICNLGFTKYRLNILEEAEFLMCQGADLHMEVLGTEHPDTIEAVEQLAWMRREAVRRSAASNREEGDNDEDEGGSDIESDGGGAESLDEDKRQDDSLDSLEFLDLKLVDSLSDFSEDSDEEGGVSLLSTHHISHLVNIAYLTSLIITGHTCLIHHCNAFLRRLCIYAAYAAYGRTEEIGSRQVSGQAAGATDEERDMTTSPKGTTTKDEVRRKVVWRGKSKMYNVTLVWSFVYLLGCLFAASGRRTCNQFSNKNQFTQNILI